MSKLNITYELKDITESNKKTSYEALITIGNSEISIYGGNEKTLSEFVDFSIAGFIVVTLIFGGRLRFYNHVAELLYNHEIDAIFKEYDININEYLNQINEINEKIAYREISGEEEIDMPYVYKSIGNVKFIYALCIKTEYEKIVEEIVEKIQEILNFN